MVMEAASWLRGDVTDIATVMMDLMKTTVVHLTISSFYHHLHHHHHRHRRHHLFVHEVAVTVFNDNNSVESCRRGTGSCATALTFDLACNARIERTK